MNELFLQGFTVEWSKIEANSYLWDIPTISGLSALQFRRPVTFMVGENGSGKSTLLEAMAIASGFNPEGGTKNYAFSTYASHSELYRALRLVRGCRLPEWGYFLRAESFYNVATQEEAYTASESMASERYHEKSHGESFLAVAQKHFRPHGLYFLDEPEAALSAQRQLTLLVDIYNCVAASFLSQLIHRYFWVCRVRKFWLLMRTAYCPALMKKRKPIRYRKCLLIIVIRC